MYVMYGIVIEYMCLYDNLILEDEACEYMCWLW